jgi:hypothetical protein
MSGARIGAVVGSVGGLVFILVNAGGLPGSAAQVVRVIGVAAFFAARWLQRPRSGEAGVATRPGRRAMRVYWLCVAAEVISIPVGANIITRVFDRPELVVLWVVAVVGAHFLPFAAAFKAPVFAPLGWILIGLAAAGVVVSLAVDDVAAAWTGVVAGVVLLGFATFGTRANRSQATGFGNGGV